MPTRSKKRNSPATSPDGKTSKPVRKLAQDRKVIPQETAMSKAPITALDAAQALVGKYAGKWELFGPGPDKETIVLKATWQDELTCSNPVLKDGRAFVTVSDIMDFGNGRTFTVNFEEGFFVKADGGAGDRYFAIDTYAQVTVERELSPEVWWFETPVSTQDMYSMGFDPQTVLAATHATIKTVTRQGSRETEWVNRISTLLSKDTSGVVQVRQFVSLKGFHTRTQ